VYTPLSGFEKIEGIFVSILVINLMNFRKNSLLLCLLYWAGCLPAQKLSLDAAFYQGTVWRHTPKLKTQSGEWIGAQEIGLQVQTTGRQDWQAWHRYPSFGVALSHFALGEGSHGRAFSFLPHLSIPLFRAGQWSADFRTGTGWSWVSDPYDWFRNPGQNAIGSHWNNITQFRLGASWQAMPRLRLNAGGSMTHFSNGGLALPNFGVNIFSAWASANWFIQELEIKDFRAAQTSKRSIGRRIGGQMQGGLGLLEIASFDGPKHAVWSGSAAGYFEINRINRALLGLDYEFNRAIYEWGLHTARFNDEASAKQGATRLAIFAGDEILFGDISIVLQAGFYIGSGTNRFVPAPNYAKLSARYYLPSLIGDYCKPFVGVSIKAHKFTAEYISGNLGLSF